MLAPVLKELELSAAVRYDNYSAIDNGVENRKIGEGKSASTYKLSARYQPTKALLFRGSLGTGFKAPSMLDIGQPLVNNGFTAASYNCPIASQEFCRPGKAQYNQLSGGNANLKAEESDQYTVGFRFEPSADFSIGADLWNLKMKNLVHLYKPLCICIYYIPCSTCMCV